MNFRLFYGVLKSRACLKGRNFGSGNGDCFACARIFTGAGCTGLNLKGAESYKRHFITVSKRFCYGIDNSLNCGFSVFLRKFCFCSNCCY